MAHCPTVVPNDTLKRINIVVAIHLRPSIFLEKRVNELMNRFTKL